MSNDVLATVRQILAPHTNNPRLFSAPPEEVSLQSLGIPSVEMIGIIIELEDRFQRVIDEQSMYELRTLRELADAVERQ